MDGVGIPCEALKKWSMTPCERNAVAAFQRGLTLPPALCCRQHGAMARELSFQHAPTRDLLDVPEALRCSLADAEIDHIAAIDAEIDRLVQERQTATERYTAVVATVPAYASERIVGKTVVSQDLLRQLVAVATDTLRHLPHEAYPRTADAELREGGCLACRVLTLAEHALATNGAPREITTFVSY